MSSFKAKVLIRNSGYTAHIFKETLYIYVCTPNDLLHTGEQNRKLFQLSINILFHYVTAK
jgi:hypothetical protein